MHAVVDARVRHLLDEVVDVVQLRAAPLTVELVVVRVGIAPFPISARRTVPTVAQDEVRHGYSGCIGVSMKGAHDGSRSVASLPSRSALRIAVTGRQKL